MKFMKYIAMVAMGLCMLAAPLNASLTTAKTYKSAVDKANPRRPVVLFCYGANYDRVSERTYQEFIKNRKLQRALRTESAVLVCVPIFQAPNEKERKEYNSIMAGGKLPGGLWSYPCLAVVDSKGILRGVVQSADQMRSPEAAAAALTELLKDFRAQEALLQKAEKASGGRKLRLLCDAAAFRTFMPKALESLDNKALVQKLDVMKPEEAHAYIRNLMATHCYSKRQRQEILAAYSGRLRRGGASPARLRAVYTEMRNIDPTSIYAIYADGAIELWVAPNEPKPAVPEKPAKVEETPEVEPEPDPETGVHTPDPEPEPEPEPEETPEPEDDAAGDDGGFASGEDPEEDEEEEGDEE